MKNYPKLKRITSVSHHNVLCTHLGDTAHFLQCDKHKHWAAVTALGWHFTGCGVHVCVLRVLTRSRELVVSGGFKLVI